MSSPLIEGAKRLEQGFENLMDKIPTPGYGSKKDTSWHDKAVADANKSFQTKTEPDSKTTPKKPVAKKRKPYKTAQ